MSRCPKKWNRQLSSSSPWHPHRIVFVWLLVVAEGTFEGEVVVHPIKQVCRLSVLTNIIMFKGKLAGKASAIVLTMAFILVLSGCWCLEIRWFVFLRRSVDYKVICLLLCSDHSVDIKVVEGRWDNVLMSFRNDGPLDQAPNVNTTILWVSDGR